LNRTVRLPIALVRLALLPFALALVLSGCAVFLNLQANTLDVLSGVASGNGDEERAIRMRRKAVELDERLFGQPSGLRLSNLAASYRRIGNYPAARALFERAVDSFDQFAPTNGAFPRALSGYADLLRRLGDYKSAQLLLEYGLTLQEERFGADDPFVIPNLTDLALLRQEVGDYERARALYERALGLARDHVGLEFVEAHQLTNLGDLHLDLRDHTTAQQLYERALRIDDAQMFGPSLLWKMWWAPQRYLPVNFQFSSYLFEANTADVLSGLARVYEATGRYTDALAAYERALALTQRLGPTHPQVAFHLMGLARIHALRGDDRAAEPLYERAIQILRAAHIPEWQWQAAFGLGRLAERAHRLDDALQLYREAVHTLQSLSEQFGDGAVRSRYLDTRDRLAPYDALASLLLRMHQTSPEQGHAELALAVLEAKKHRIVGHTFAIMKTALDPATLASSQRVRGKRDEVLGLEAALRDEQARDPSDQHAPLAKAITTRLAKTKAEYAEQVQDFLRLHPRYKSQFIDQYAIDPRLLTKLAGRLPPNTMALEYFAAPDRLYVFMATSDGKFAVRSRSVAQDHLYRLVRAYRTELARAETRRLPWNDDGSEDYRREVSPLRRLTQELATHLLGPVEPELDAYAQLVVIPNDLLLYLPIHALTRERPDHSSQFLAETHTVSYLTQLEVVDLGHPARPAAIAPLLAFGDPDGSLPAASDELRALQALRTSVVVLQGAEATKPRFLELAHSFSDFHFATHGVLDPGRPDRSYLLMAGSDEDSQRLGLREIAGLTLVPNGLVILSACDTALGEQVPGAALMTFAAAFSQAGAESIVASLWRVNDRAARDLMVGFHRALQTTDRVVALHQAQRGLLRNPATSHPYYWAPFILVGAR
jgi:CHAT domain-containing protein